MRQQLLENWLKKYFASRELIYELLPGDASLRKYCRVFDGKQSYIVMDAPPPENIQQFSKVARALWAIGVHVPEIFAENLEQGFLLLSDFGDNLYEKILTTVNMQQYYLQAIDNIILLQNCNLPVPVFDTIFIEKQFQVFYQWYFKSTDHGLAKMLDSINDYVTSIPQCFVHMDFHSRNLLLTADHKTGVIDFQDAMVGPITYDIISILYDYYCVVPADLRHELIRYYYDKLVGSKKVQVDFQEFSFWIDVVALQRHVKNLGVFARLRDFYNKPQYNNYIPQNLQYIKLISLQNPEFRALGDILCER